MSTRVDVLVYDGDCGFCTTAAEWIVRQWDDGRAIARPRQRLDQQMIERAGVGDDDLRREVWWVSDRGNASGSAAIARALQAADGPWSLVGRLIASPPVSWIAPSIYRIVARHRHRLPGATATCAW